MRSMVPGSTLLKGVPSYFGNGFQTGLRRCGFSVVGAEWYQMPFMDTPPSETCGARSGGDETGV